MKLEERVRAGLRARVANLRPTRFLTVGLGVALLSAPLVVAASVAASGSTQTICSDEGPFGSPLLSGSAWLNGSGVDVYSNGTVCNLTSTLNQLASGVTTGLQWQSTELVNRLYLTKGWIRATWIGRADQFYATAPIDLIRQPQGQISSVSPGDVVVLSGGAAGQVSIVDTVSANAGGGATVALVNQNTVGARATATLNNGTLTTSLSLFAVIGVVRAPQHVSLNRYYNPSIPNHVLAVSQPPGGYYLEGPLGAALTTPASGTRMIYDCRSGWDEFASASSVCDGQTVVGSLGYAYTSPHDSVPTIGLYSCLVNWSGERFETNHADCEGQTLLGTLGFLVGRAMLNRYYNPALSTPDHWSIPGPAPAGYQFQRALGALMMTPTAGTQVVYACLAGTDEFTSLSPGCEGQSVIGPYGYDYTTPRSGLSTYQLYRCRVTASGELFDTLDARCEGQTSDKSLGFVPIRL